MAEAMEKLLKLQEDYNKKNRLRVLILGGSTFVGRTLVRNILKEVHHLDLAILNRGRKYWDGDWQGAFPPTKENIHETNTLRIFPGDRRKMKGKPFQDIIAKLTIEDKTRFYYDEVLDYIAKTHGAGDENGNDNGNQNPSSSSCADHNGKKTTNMISSTNPSDPSDHGKMTSAAASSSSSSSSAGAPAPPQDSINKKKPFWDVIVDFCCFQESEFQDVMKGLYLAGKLVCDERWSLEKEKRENHRVHPQVVWDHAKQANVVSDNFPPEAFVSHYIFISTDSVYEVCGLEKCAKERIAIERLLPKKDVENYYKWKFSDAKLLHTTTTSTSGAGKSDSKQSLGGKAEVEHGSSSSTTSVAKILDPDARKTAIYDLPEMGSIKEMDGRRPSTMFQQYTAQLRQNRILGAHKQELKDGWRQSCRAMKIADRLEDKEGKFLKEELEFEAKTARLNERQQDIGYAMPLIQDPEVAKRLESKWNDMDDYGHKKLRVEEAMVKLTLKGNACSASSHQPQDKSVNFDMKLNKNDETYFWTALRVPDILGPYDDTNRLFKYWLAFFVVEDIQFNKAEKEDPVAVVFSEDMAKFIQDLVIDVRFRNMPRDFVPGGTVVKVGACGWKQELQRFWTKGDSRVDKPWTAGCGLGALNFGCEEQVPLEQHVRLFREIVLNDGCERSFACFQGRREAEAPAELTGVDTTDQVHQLEKQILPAGSSESSPGSSHSSAAEQNVVLQKRQKTTTDVEANKNQERKTHDEKPGGSSGTTIRAPPEVVAESSSTHHPLDEKMKEGENKDVAGPRGGFTPDNRVRFQPAHDPCLEKIEKIKAARKKEAAQREIEEKRVILNKNYLPSVSRRTKPLDFEKLSQYLHEVSFSGKVHQLPISSDVDEKTSSLEHVYRKCHEFYKKVVDRAIVEVEDYRNGKRRDSKNSDFIGDFYESFVDARKGLPFRVREEFERLAFEDGGGTKDDNDDHLAREKRPGDEKEKPGDEKEKPAGKKDVVMADALAGGCGKEDFEKTKAKVLKLYKMMEELENESSSDSNSSHDSESSSG
ncbi:unnamed protein product [Amoebophrya sp. A120]|nr:unnamed protein product [Amoebophrya sp. A120]|eukprot:GSA120T00024528001.1